MKKPLDDTALDTLFREARSYNRWTAEPVPETTAACALRLAQDGPHLGQLLPGAIRIRREQGGQGEAARGASTDANVVKVQQAPVTAIIAMDEKFYEKVPYLFPHKPEIAEMFKDPHVGKVTMMRNATLQGAYLILAARSLGLDTGPMSGFSNDKVDEAFLAGTSYKSNFLCALGVGTTEHLFARSPRLSFEEACRMA